MKKHIYISLSLIPLILLLALVGLYLFNMHRTVNVETYLSDIDMHITTSKQKGGKFSIYFQEGENIKGYSLENIDYIEFETGSYINIIINSENKDIHIAEHGIILKINKKKYNIDTISDSIFYSRYFDNNKQKEGYHFLSIDTSEYGVSLDGEIIKKGSITGR